MSNDLLVISRKGNYRKEYPPPVPERRLYSDEELLPIIEKNREEQVQRAKRGELEEDEEHDWAVGLMCSGELDGICITMEFKSIDGCSVEVDGNCPHGYKSPLLLLSLV